MLTGVGFWSGGKLLFPVLSFVAGEDDVLLLSVLGRGVGLSGSISGLSGSGLLTISFSPNPTALTTMNTTETLIIKRAPAITTSGIQFVGWPKDGLERAGAACAAEAGATIGISAGFSAI